MGRPGPAPEARPSPPAQAQRRTVRRECQPRRQARLWGRWRCSAVRLSASSARDPTTKLLANHVPGTPLRSMRPMSVLGWSNTTADARIVDDAQRKKRPGSLQMGARLGGWCSSLPVRCAMAGSALEDCRRRSPPESSAVDWRYLRSRKHRDTTFRRCAPVRWAGPCRRRCAAGRPGSARRAGPCRGQGTRGSGRGCAPAGRRRPA